jgi:formylglycine-generating enzyme required for sulfatase activity
MCRACRSRVEWSARRTLQVYWLLTVVAGLGNMSCASLHTRSTSSETSDLDRLVASAQMEKRSEWWPAVQELGRIAATDEARREEVWRRAKVNTLGMKFVLVHPGVFRMGPEHSRLFDFQSAHSVELTRPYYISVAEVTNAQYQQVVPAFRADAKYSPDADSPAVNVSWKHAVRFCELLSEREGACYRLPTEAEWEYACRAGSETKYCYGNGAKWLSQYAWYGNAKRRASAVAMLKPNAWGLYDMHGNVMEWASDYYSHSYYRECAAKGIVEDPSGPASGWTHVLRGGAWCTDPDVCTSTFRAPYPLLQRVPFDPDPVRVAQVVGFRVVREAD